MCRLAARFGSPASPEALVFGGTHPLAEQAWAPRELLHGTVNADGWGVAWTPVDAAEARMVRLARAEPIWYDPEARTLLGVQRGTAMLAALRNATPGLPVDRSGRLPLVVGDHAFALNGFVPDFRARHMRALRAGLTEAGYGRLTGVSDAETLFLRVLDRIEAGGNPVEALLEERESVGARLDAGRAAPLTMVFASPDTVVALHSSAGGPVNSLYLHEAGGPVPGGPAIASEPLTADGWVRVPDHSVVVLDARGARIREVGPLPGRG